MSALTDLLKAGATAGIPILANQLFGADDAPIIRAAQSGSQNALNFRGGGLSGTNQGGTFVVRPTNALRQSNVTKMSREFGGTANELARLRRGLAPGFGLVTDARLGEIESARRRTIGNLSDNLKRRSVLGSSFGSDAIARAEAEFSQQAAKAKAQSFLEELDVNTQLLAQETNASINAVQVLMDELNTQLGIASKSAVPLAQVMANSGRLAAEYMAEAARGRGQLIGRAAETVAQPLVNLAFG